MKMFYKKDQKCRNLFERDLSRNFQILYSGIILDKTKLDLNFI